MWGKLTDYPAVSGWLRGVTENTNRRYRYYIQEFCSLSKLGPRQLVSLAHRDKMTAKEKMVEFYREYVRIPIYGPCIEMFQVQP